MSKFILLSVVILIAVGLMLHYNVSIAALPHWVGRLPGDLALEKGDTVVYFPVTTALIFSAGLSLISYMLFK